MEPPPWERRISKKKEEANALNTKVEATSESSTKRTKPREPTIKFTDEEESTAVGSEIENDDDLSDKKPRTLKTATKKAHQKDGDGYRN